MNGPSPVEVAAALEHYCHFSAEEAWALATAGLEQVRPPHQVPGMKALAGRIAAALRRRQPLLIFGDFDADGITGSAVLFRCCSHYSDQTYRYTPFYREDYGLHPRQVERFAQQGIRLIVTVDTGITSHAAVERARQLGLEVLIIDHHLPNQGVGPPDTPWVNPADRTLCGSQLAYLAAQAIRQELGGEDEHDPWGLTLSALGAQVDRVPVDRAETRAWASAGHRFLHSPECPQGLQVLREVLGEAYTPSEMRSLGSILNMAKRSVQVDPNAIVEALLPECGDDQRRELFRFLCQERARVSHAAAAVTAQAMEDTRKEINQPGLLIYEVYVADPTLTEIEGPLASRLASVTKRPTLVMRPAGGRISFSGRAWGTFSFESFLDDGPIQAAVIQMGGHVRAIGGSLHPQDRSDFLRAVRLWEQHQPPALPADRPYHPPAVLECLDPTVAFLLGRAIGPFGQNLRPPRFRSTLSAKGGWAYSGECLIELDRSLEAGEWEVLYRLDEAACDGQNVALRVQRAWPAHAH